MADCPICGEAAARRWRPFCSKRCADIDLGRWMTGRYALPSEEPVDPALLDAAADGAADDPEKQ